MDFYINLKVNFRGNSKNFLLSGSETKSWESMEAMVSRDEQQACCQTRRHTHGAHAAHAGMGVQPSGCDGDSVREVPGVRHVAQTCVPARFVTGRTHFEQLHGRAVIPA